MNTYYLFTDITGKEVVELNNDFQLGIEALNHRKELQKKYKKPIIAWALMGEENPRPQVLE